MIRALVIATRSEESRRTGSKIKKARFETLYTTEEGTKGLVMISVTVQGERARNRCHKDWLTDMHGRI